MQQLDYKIIINLKTKNIKGKNRMAKKVIEVDETIVQMKVEMNKLLEEIKELDYKLAELREMFILQSEELTNKFEERQLSLNNKRDYLRTQLKFLFEQVPQHETKTMKKVELLSGDVIVKKAKEDFEKDTEKLIEWAQANQREEFLSKKEVLSFKWSDFKKSLVPTEEGIVDVNTGEILNIKGLNTIMKSEELEIKY